MHLDRKNALRIWEDTYGKVVEATDFSGRKINKSAYEQRNSKFGWVVAYLLPKAEGGRDNPENLVCMHSETAAEKGDDFPFFTVNDKKYRLTNESEEALGKWFIEEALDSESLAEQEAKNAAALEKWEALFGEEYENAIDFCGREIHKSEYNTDSEYAWKIAPYVDSKPTENRNAYIAHVLSIEEALGRTAFKANGKNYTLNKENGAYFFKLIEIKPRTEPAPDYAFEQQPQLMIRPKIKKGLKLRLNVKAEPAPESEKPSETVEAAPVKLFDIKNAYDVAAKFGEIKNGVGADDNAMMDFIIVRAVTNPGCSASAAQTVADTVSMILNESAGDYIAFELSDMADEQSARYMFLTYRFLTPSPAGFEKVFAAARLLNTYSPMLLQELGLSELKIYNYASFINRTQLRYPVSLLSAYNPIFKELMDGIYAGSFDYPGISATTLFVSHFIVFNVPELAAAHPEGATQYMSVAEMVEHNAFDTDAKAVMLRYLSGEPEKASEPVENELPVTESVEEEQEAQIETVTLDEASEPIAEYEPYAKEAYETVTEETAHAEEIFEAETEEIASVEENSDEAEPVEERVEAEIIEPVTFENESESADEPNYEPEQSENVNLASKLASTLANALSYTEHEDGNEVTKTSEKEALNEPADPISSENDDYLIAKKTPEGEQLTMAFPSHDGAQDEDGVLTIDLDVLD